ncbi:MAG: viral A-type inclusion protein [Chitinophagaceae bacterium]
MKKNILSGIFFLVFVACNNYKSEGTLNNDSQKPKTQADSLMDEVMDGHDAGMGKMSKISKMQNEITRLLDSIGKLPAKARRTAATYKIKLDSLKANLSYAEMSMNKWMDEFNMDSALNNIDQRIKYLTDEKVKVGKVKAAILGSLHKADSLIKRRL